MIYKPVDLFPSPPGGYFLLFFSPEVNNFITVPHGANIFIKCPLSYFIYSLLPGDPVSDSAGF